MFLNNRHHDPTLGSFVSVDPLIVDTGLPYAYTAGDPINYSDPTGLCTFVSGDLYCGSDSRNYGSNGSGLPNGCSSCGDLGQRKGLIEMGEDLAPVPPNVVTQPEAYLSSEEFDRQRRGLLEFLSDLVVEFTVIDDGLMRLLESARLRQSGADRRPRLSPVPPSAEPLLTEEFVAAVECVSAVQAFTSNLGAVQVGAQPSLFTGFGPWVGNQAAKSAASQIGGAVAGQGFPALSSCVRTD